MEQTLESDKGLGLGVVFALVALVGALAMLFAPGQIGKAWGFAAAMVAAALAVVAIQAYGA
jgi:type II secretory pathway pseudopilin PulG